MHYTRVALLSALTASTAVLAQNPGGDIPTACQEVCAPVVSLANSCEPQDELDDNDQAYINCICGGQDAETQVPLCEACVRANDVDDDLDDNPNDNDVNDWVRSCSWTTTSWTGSASQPTQTGSAPAGNTASPTTIPDDCFDFDDDDRNDPRCSGVTNSAGQVTATPAPELSDDLLECLVQDYDFDDDNDDDDDDYNSPRCQSVRESFSSSQAANTGAASANDAIISSASSRVAAAATGSPSDGAAPAAATAGIAGVAGAAVLGYLMA